MSSYRPSGPAARPAAVSRRSGPHTSAGPTLTPLLAVLLLLGLSAVGGAIDLSLGNGLDVAYAILFVAGCGLAAAGVARRHLLVPVFSPPLVLGGTAVAATLANTSPLTLVNVAADVFIRLLESAPVLFGGTALAAVIALVRRLSRRR